MLRHRTCAPNFSEIFPAVYSLQDRERKARTILAVLRDFLKKDPSGTLLDIGSSTGAIAHHLADSFDEVIGVDVDRSALQFAQQNFKKSNLGFGLVDGTYLPFRDGNFDVVTCTHIYEHVTDPESLLREIRRVLKPGGLCYFAAANRLWPLEFHYRLLFLSWLPPAMSNIYLKLSGLGDTYDVKLLTLWSLRSLVKGFSVIDYTPKMVQDPASFDVEYMLAAGSVTQRLAMILVKFAYWLFPTYIWILH
jgi:ubiquinone/menaquinone biosynthesis C-methylase UbiE